MFCPQCKAEYRKGFTRCADCDVDLVALLPDRAAEELLASADERPDQAPPAIFLAWFAPMVFFFAFYVLVAARPAVLHNFFFAVFLTAFIFAQSTGGFWMLYQAVRYEKKVARYVLLSFVPFMFVWYSLVRYPLRRELPRLP